MLGIYRAARARRAAAAALVSLSLGAAPLALGADSTPCTDNSRDCMIRTAFTYLNALVTHDVASIRVAPNAYRMNVGHLDAHTGDELRAAAAREPVGDHFDFRWTVDGDEAVAIYDLDADLTRTAQSDVFTPTQTQVPAFIAERFRVRDGLIHEIEVIYNKGLNGSGTTLTPRPERPLRPMDWGPGPCGTDDRDCVVQSAGAYLGALLSHDGTTVPLAPDAWRIEDGRNTGDNAEQIRTALRSPATAIAADVTDVRWFVEGEQAVAYYVVWSDASAAVGAPGTDTPVRTPTYVGTRFRVQHGLIKEIETSTGMDRPGAQPDPRPLDS